MTWQQRGFVTRAARPTKANAAAATCGKRIYIAGGESSPELVESYAAGLTDRRVETALPTGRAFHTMVELQGKLYLIGGKRGMKGFSVVDIAVMSCHVRT